MFPVPPTAISTQSHDPFGNLGNLTAPSIAVSSQSNDPFAYLGNISTSPAKSAPLVIPTANDSLFATTITNSVPLISASMVTPTAGPNFNDLVVPLETITPGA